jgi:phosphoserine phosphatase RsbU/P
MSAATPVSPYQQALDRFRREGRELPLLRRMSELISLLDLTTTLSSGLGSHEILGAALRIVMEELDVERGVLFVRDEDGRFAVRAAHALPPGAPSTLLPTAPLDDLTALEATDEARVRYGLVLLCPILRRNRPIALLGLGPRARGQAYSAEEGSYLRGVAACSSTAIENGLLYSELRRVNQRLSAKVFQLHNLFDISRELAGSFEEQAILGLVATTVMGHFVVARCGLYLLEPAGLVLAEERGLPRELRRGPIPPDEAREALQELSGPRPVAELSEGSLRRRLEEARLVLAVPLCAGSGVVGILAIGERASRTAFSEEDGDFAQALARQAQAALENARLNRLRVEKQRQDHELQIARQIQRTLLPPRCPEIAGFELAADSRSCFEVGGDSYDWIPLPGQRLALVVADVSGKGTPASLLMASVHAYLQALAGTAAPAEVVERLNRFLFASTQPSRFVTVFYAELDPTSRRLDYVNAGHVPPCRVRRDGTVTRLSEGGPAVGLLEPARYEAGQVRLEPGDVVAMVTDGVTEANSPDEREFGDERVCESLRAHGGESAAGILEGVVRDVASWAGAAGFSDDLTAMILKAR